MPDAYTTATKETPAHQLVRAALWIAAIDAVPIEDRVAKVDEWAALVDHYRLIEHTVGLEPLPWYKRFWCWYVQADDPYRDEAPDGR